MNKEELEASARDAAKGIKTEADLAEISQILKKTMVEAALNVKMTDHPGYDKHQDSTGPDSRNGYSANTVIKDLGTFELNPARDRDGSFIPLLIKNRQTRFTAMDQIIIYLYAQGMTNREIVDMFKEMYRAEETD